MMNHPRPTSEHVERMKEMIAEWIKPKPVIVIDLETLQFRPCKYQ